MIDRLIGKRAASAYNSNIARLVNHASSPEPDAVVDCLKAFEDAGTEEIMIQYFGMNGNTQLDVLSESVLPHFTQKKPRR